MLSRRAKLGYDANSSISALAAQARPSKYESLAIRSSSEADVSRSPKGFTDMCYWRAFEKRDRHKRVIHRDKCFLRRYLSYAGLSTRTEEMGYSKNHAPFRRLAGIFVATDLIRVSMITRWKETDSRLERNRHCLIMFRA